MAELGKLLVGLGLLMATVGAVLWLCSRAGFPLGHLPGDLSYRGRNFRVYFPLGTSVLLSVAISVVLYLISRLRR